MSFIIDCWWIIVVLIAAITLAVLAIIKFIQTPTNEQMIMVKNWLLQAVTEAERQFGSKTGSVKLSFCYNAFINAFPKLAMVIPFETFSNLVDEVLEKFRVMLESNVSLKEYVDGANKEV